MSHSSFAHFTGMVRAATAESAVDSTETEAGPAGGGSTAESRIVPVWRDCLFDVDTPVSAFAKLRRSKAQLKSHSSKVAWYIKQITNGYS